MRATRPLNHWVFESLGLRVQCLGLRVLGLGFRVWGLGFRVLGFRGGLGFCSLGSRALGLYDSRCKMVQLRST